MNELKTNILEKSIAARIPDDIEKFYLDTEIGRITWVYYNPDSSAGGQLVYNYVPFNLIFKAIEMEMNDETDALDYVQSCCYQELVDIDTPAFNSAALHFIEDKADFVVKTEFVSVMITTLADAIRELMSNIDEGRKVSDIKRIAYELYKIDWTNSHISAERQLSTYRAYCEENWNKSTFEEYLTDSGFDGECYVCFNEFLDCEYQDKDYIKRLLSEEQYEAYQADIKE